MYARLIATGTITPESTPATSCRDYGFSPAGLCMSGFDPWWIGAACVSTGYSPKPTYP